MIKELKPKSPIFGSDKCYIFKFDNSTRMSVLFCLLVVSFLFPARFIAVVSIVSICLVCDPSIVANCPSIPVGRFAFRLYFIRFVSVVHSCFVCLSGEPKQNQGRGLVDRKLVQAPPPPQ